MKRVAKVVARVTRHWHTHVFKECGRDFYEITKPGYRYTGLSVDLYGRITGYLCDLTEPEVFYKMVVSSKCTLCPKEKKESFYDSKITPLIRRGETT